MRGQNDVQVDLSARVKAMLIAGLVAGAIAAGCSRIVGFWPASEALHNSGSEETHYLPTY